MYIIKILKWYFDKYMKIINIIINFQTTVIIIEYIINFILKKIKII